MTPRPIATSPRAPFAARSFVVALALLSALACGGGDGDPEAESELDTAAVVEGEDGAAGAESGEEDVPAEEESAASDAAAGDTINRRPADIEVAITGSDMYAGNYRAAGTSRMCGMESFALPGQQPRFQFQFPYEGDFEIVDVSFSAQDLAFGGTSSRYHLDVALRTKRGGRPPGFVIRAGERQGESGTAALAQEGEQTVLRVQGRNSQGSLTMTVRCGRRPPG